MRFAGKWAITFALWSAIMFACINYAFSDGPGNLLAPNKHNLSATLGGTVYKAVSETQVCVFCHTPHRSLIEGPLWNHTLTTQATYTLPSSPTQKTTPENPPDGDSRLCLSCHDGTVSLGAVQNLGGQSLTVMMSIVGTGPLAGPSVLTTDISGHHLVSIVQNQQLHDDKNLQCTSGAINFGVKLPGNVTPPVVLRPTSNVYGGSSGNGVQCTSCHDPHYDASLNNKFLRAGLAGSWSTVSRNYSDALCMACHCSCNTTSPCTQ